MVSYKVTMLDTYDLDGKVGHGQMLLIRVSKLSQWDRVVLSFQPYIICGYCIVSVCLKVAKINYIKISLK